MQKIILGTSIILLGLSLTACGTKTTNETHNNSSSPQVEKNLSKRIHKKKPTLKTILLKLKN